MSSWKKLGRDLDFAFEQGTLKSGVRPVWKLVRGCLEDQRCSEAVENGQAIGYLSWGLAFLGARGQRMIQGS